jgi:hypothetical protein
MFTTDLAAAQLLLALFEAPSNFFAAVKKMVHRALDIVATCFVIISFAMGRPSNAGPLAELKPLQQKLSASIGFLATAPMLLILQFGLIAIVPAPATSPELAMLVPIIIGFLLVLQFLLLGLLHVGASNAVSHKLPKFANRVETPFTACNPCGVYEVDPPRPRFLA